MARPLWKNLRSVRSQSTPPNVTFMHPLRFKTAIVAGLGAVAALTVSSTLGNLHGKVHQKVITLVAAGCFVVLSVIAVRALASSLGSLVASRGGASSASAVRLITTIGGYLIVLTVTLGMLDVPIQHLLLGGAITGVILGIAAQQALGNVFAGLVLLLARPFSVGQHIRVKSGTYGGEFDGVVLSMTLTYVTISTSSGLLKVPNAGMLAAAVGPFSPSTATSSPLSANDIARAAAALSAAADQATQSPTSPSATGGEASNRRVGANGPVPPGNAPGEGSAETVGASGGSGHDGAGTPWGSRRQWARRSRFTGHPGGPPREDPPREGEPREDWQPPGH